MILLEIWLIQAPGGLTTQKNKEGADPRSDTDSGRADDESKAGSCIGRPGRKFELFQWRTQSRYM